MSILQVHQDVEGHLWTQLLTNWSDLLQSLGPHLICKNNIIISPNFNYKYKEKFEIIIEYYYQEKLILLPLFHLTDQALDHIFLSQFLDLA